MVGEAEALGRRSVVILDIIGSTQLMSDTQVAFYKTMRDAVRDAASAAGLDLPGWRFQDQGDGLVAVLPPNVREADLLTRFVDELTRLLELFNRTRTRRARLRLRLAIGHGHLQQAEGGYVGPVIADIKAVVDSQALRAYARSQDSLLLATALTSDVYTEMVATGKTRYEADDFFAVTVRNSESDTTAWIRGGEPPNFDYSRPQARRGGARPADGRSPEVRQKFVTTIFNDGGGTISIGAVHLGESDEPW